MLDGKTIKSTDAIKTIEKMMNIVTAYTDTGISIGQITVDSKSNEISAVRKEVYAMFDDKYIDTTDKDCEYEIYSTTEKSHGRTEKRTCYVLNEIEFFTEYLTEWKGLKKIFAVKRKIKKDIKKTTEISCYLSSIIS